MTREEAGEVILAGDAFKCCMHCDGVGSTPASRERYKRAIAEREARVAHNASFGLDRKVSVQEKWVSAAEFIVKCDRCGGEGVVVVGAYAEACAVLGLELPLTGYQQLRKVAAAALGMPQRLLFGTPRDNDK